MYTEAYTHAITCLCARRPIRTHMYTEMHTSTQSCIDLGIYSNGYICMYSCVLICTHMYAHAYTYVCTLHILSMPTYTLAYISMHTHTCIHKLKWNQVTSISLLTPTPMRVFNSHTVAQTHSSPPPSTNPPQVILVPPFQFPSTYATCLRGTGNAIKCTAISSRPTC